MTDNTPDIWTRGSGLLTIDLDAIAANYRMLRDTVAPASCGACVKADCYGLGLERVAPILAAAGCEDFFVSFLEGGIRLRQLLPDVRIHVFTGLSGGAPSLFEDHRLIPTLNSLGDIEAWRAYCHDQEKRLPGNIQVDTGMLRLGLPPDELERIAKDRGLIEDMNIDTVMSHLACADDRRHPKTAEQLMLFRQARDILPMGRASLANSSGIFHGSDFHCDMARPGAALYGINPTPGNPSPVSQVIRLQGKILQVRSVDTPQTVGYGATHLITEPGRIATVGVGYADGYLRAASGSGMAYIDDIPVPVVGRVSMDMITLDVSAIPEHRCQPGMAVDLIGPHHNVDDLAAEAGTIGYELLTALGNRYHRVYTGETDGRNYT